MKHGLNGPWLNLNEVRLKTGLVKNETLFRIHEGDVIPTLYTHNRPFLAMTRALDGTLTGHAVFRYSGPIGIDTTVIDELITQEKSMIGQRTIQLLRIGNLTEWCSLYPYQGMPPNGILDKWEPHNIFNAQTSNYLFIHLPHEHSNFESAESAFVEHVPELYDEDDYFNLYSEKYLIQSPNTDHIYGTDHYSVYCQHDLRLPLSALQHLSTPSNESIDPIIDNPPPATRTKELHTVIDRIVIQYPEARSNVLWNYLRLDCKKTPRNYDPDELITHIDNNIIYWTSTNGVQQILKKTSFQTLVSRIRKQYKEVTPHKT